MLIFTKMDVAVGSLIWFFTQKHSDFKLNVSDDGESYQNLYSKQKSLVLS